MDATAILVMNNNCPGCSRRVADKCDDINTAVAGWWGDKEHGEWTCYMSMIRDPRCPFDPTHWMPLPDPP
jgi:hypothetical protein